MSVKKFFGIIGNPPYQGEAESKNGKQYKPPIYNTFMSEAYQVGEKVELVTPARFLFNAGATPQEWNKQMLADEHLKVEEYETDGSRIFPGTDIKGGIAITYRDASQKIGPIGTFIPFKELETTWDKVKNSKGFSPISEIMGTRGEHKVSNVFKKDFPNWNKVISDARFSASIFKRFPEIFAAKKPNDKQDYIQMLGVVDNKRVTYWVRRDYVSSEEGFIDYYRVCVPKANGSGSLGEVFSTPVIGTPTLGTTESFIPIGKFETEEEAENCLKYVKSKFFRVLVGILKVTQNNPAEVFACVPQQNFTDESDIDWSTTIQEIDQQLYAKYDLTPEEIDFIETNVKEMQ